MTNTKAKLTDRLASAIREAAARPHMSDHCDTCNTAALVGRSTYLPIGVTCDVCEVSHALYAKLSEIRVPYLIRLYPVDDGE